MEEQTDGWRRYTPAKGARCKSPCGFDPRLLRKLIKEKKLFLLWKLKRDLKKIESYCVKNNIQELDLSRDLPKEIQKIISRYPILMIYSGLGGKYRRKESVEETYNITNSSK